MSTIVGPSLAGLVRAFHAGSEEVVADPYPLYARLRREAPVCEQDDITLVTRYADVLQLIQDDRMSARKGDTDLARAQIASLPAADQAIARRWFDFQTGILGMTDPPDHTRRRRLQIHGFMPRQLRAVEDYVVATTDRLLDAIEERGEVDFVAALAYPLPMLVIAHMLGVPERDMPRIVSWSQDVGVIQGRGYHHVPAHAAGLTAFMDYVADTVASRRTSPRDDLLGALIAAEEEGDKLSTDELVVSFFNLLFSGHETTTTLLAMGMLTLLQNPEQWRLVGDDPGRAGDAVEELLRFVTPVQFITRVALEDVPLDGGVVRRGPSVRLSLGSANHDPEAFADPDRFDIDRQGDARGLFFGKGIHYCMGNALARLEAVTAFSAIARRFPGIHLTGEPLVWRPNPLMRRTQTLAVSVRPAG